jgi:hypothetical protein
MHVELGAETALHAALTRNPAIDPIERQGEGGENSHEPLRERIRQRIVSAEHVRRQCEQETAEDGTEERDCVGKAEMAVRKVLAQSSQDGNPDDEINAGPEDQAALPDGDRADQVQKDSARAKHGNFGSGFKHQSTRGFSALIIYRGLRHNCPI